MGARRRSIETAVSALSAQPGISLVGVSRLYRTPPAGGVARGYFLNAAVAVEHLGEPSELLLVCKELETKLGRRRGRRWGDRPLDLDILWWEGGSFENPHLSIPHPRLKDRSFALEPLLDLFPNLRDETGQPYALHAARLPTPAAVGVLAAPSCRVMSEGDGTRVRPEILEFE